MRRPQRFARRTALGLLTAWPLCTFSERAAASQAEALTAAEFNDEQDVSRHLSELTRPLVLVNLWAAWCPGCLTEMPTIRELASRFGPDAIDIVLLSHRMNWDGDRAYVQEAHLPFPHWRLSAHAPDAIVAAAFGIQGGRFGLPQSLVFAGRKRMLVASWLGSQDWVAPERLRLVRGWLDAAG